MAKSRKNLFGVFFRCHILSSAHLGEPKSIWVLTSSRKLKCQRDVLSNTIVSKKSVADLLPLEKSGERNAVVVRR